MPDLHFNELITFYVIFMFYNAMVGALPDPKTVKNPWAKFFIKVLICLGGQLRHALEKYPELSGKLIGRHETPQRRNTDE